MENDFLNRMLSFAREAGELAQDLIADSRPTLKSDNSVVTLADKEVSLLASELFKDIIGSPEHIFIDEENPLAARFLDEGLITKAKYLWALDPIDGTRSYSEGMPTYGISIGIMRDLKPWQGVVYMPGLRELFYADGTRAVHVRDPFTPQEKKTVIVPQLKSIDHFTAVFMSEMIFRDFDVNFKNMHVMAPACGVIDFCWPAIGRGCGGVLTTSLWDFAGAWPVFQAAGLQLRALTTGEVLDHVNLRCFYKDQSPWKLNDYYVLSTAENFSTIKSRLVRKDTIV